MADLTLENPGGIWIAEYKLSRRKRKQSVPAHVIFSHLPSRHTVADDSRGWFNTKLLTMCYCTTKHNNRHLPSSLQNHYWHLYAQESHGESLNRIQNTKVNECNWPPRCLMLKEFMIQNDVSVLSLLRGSSQVQNKSSQLQIQLNTQSHIQRLSVLRRGHAVPSGEPIDSPVVTPTTRWMSLRLHSCSCDLQTSASAKGVLQRKKSAAGVWMLWVQPNKHVACLVWLFSGWFWYISLLNPDLVCVSPSAYIVISTLCHDRFFLKFFIIVNLATTHSKHGWGGNPPPPHHPDSKAAHSW